jgi:hypothetical protein
VAFLTRFTEKGKAVNETYRAQRAETPGKPPACLGEMIALGAAATEVKKPGDKEWATSGSAAAATINMVACKGGEMPEVVEPQ